MTCKDIMTPDPSCCMPGDSVSIAAQIMRRNDVGPVLVVSDHHDNRLVGIVTDRDLALKVIADERDPRTTRVEEVMSLHPVCCKEDDSTQLALQLMAEHQVRRIPVVDSDNRLRGIVAQADIARHEDEDDVGRMVEQISEPYGSSSWTELRGSGPSAGAWSGGGALALGSLCMGLGAGLMYVLDSSRGGTEPSSGASSDRETASRIRSGVARKVSYPDAVGVKVLNGHVELSGPVLAGEVRALIDCVTGTEGVQSVESRLDVHDYPGSHPELRGRAHRHHADSSHLPLLAGLAAGGLLLFGLRSRGRALLGQTETVRRPRGETPGY